MHSTSFTTPELPFESKQMPLTALQRVGKMCAAFFLGDREPRIWKIMRADGTTHWKVYDPNSHRSSTFSSENDVRVWLDRRYYE
ncbi:MAG: hypothetical protein AAFY15_02220 [Cyanobacteria bacterium J06648_11]